MSSPETAAFDDSQYSSGTENESAAAALQDRVAVLLQSRVRVRSFSIEILKKGLVLHGFCDSYHAKQMAQEIVSQNTNLRIIGNKIEVTSYQQNGEHESRVVSSFLALPKQVGKEKENQQPFETVFFQSHSSSDSDLAFAHALKIALQSKANLKLMQVDDGHQTEWEDFPSVQEALRRWNVIPEGSSKAKVAQLGVAVEKVIASSTNPVDACLEYLEVNEVDLIVMPIQQREGLLRGFGKISGERIPAGSKQVTLFIPFGQEGFVSSADGSVSLNNILVPVIKKPRAESAIAFIRKLIQSLGVCNGTVTLLHVGTSDTMPFVQYPQIDGWTWNRVRLEGDRIETILKFGEDLSADLIAMTTDGPDRFIDGFRGTTSERILRRTTCPVAIVPV